MSTKIYNGYYSDLKLEPLLVKLKSLVNDFKSLKLIEYAKFLSEETVKRIDRNSSIDNNLSHQKILDKVYISHEEEIKKTENSHKRLFNCDDFSASCCLLPLGNKTLILFYSDNDKVLKLWESLDFIHDYHYQNQCDRPENITARQWNIRKKNWDKVLGGNGYGIPMENGYTFTLSTIDLPYFHNIKSLINNFIIDKDTRAKEILYNKTYAKIFDEKKKECDEKSLNIINYLGTIHINTREYWEEFKTSDTFNIELKKIKETLVSINFDNN